MKSPVYKKNDNGGKKIDMLKRRVLYLYIERRNVVMIIH